jgi:hypothetical protein
MMSAKNMAHVLLIVTLAAIASPVHARPPRSLAGLWVATADDAVFWLRATVSSSDGVALIEDVSGTLAAQRVGGDDPARTELPVTGQYLPGNRIVVLNFGEPGPGRKYAIGETAAEPSGPMNLKLFRLRPGHGVDFETQLWFSYKGGLPETPALTPSPLPPIDAAARHASEASALRCP